MKRRIPILALMVCFPYIAGAQALHEKDYHSNVKSVATPNAASMAQYGSVPVDLFTGIPNISVPLFEVNYGGINVPVALSYNAAGVKVNSVPGWAGMNWNLNAGSITRKVNHVQDEFNNINSSMVNNAVVVDKGYFFTGNALDVSTWNSTSSMINKLNTYNNELYAQGGIWKALVWDGEPDEFTFSFGNYSGSFYRSEKGEWKVKSKQNIAIEIAHEMVTGADQDFEIWDITIPANHSRVASLFTKFTLTTPDGYTYIFGGDTSTIEFSRGQIFGTPSIENFAAPVQEHRANYITANTWYLAKIITPLGAEVVFHYNRGLPLFQQSKGYTPGCMDADLSAQTEAKFRPSVTVTNPVYLSYIETPFMRYEFKRSKAIEMMHQRFPDPVSDGMDLRTFRQTITANWSDLDAYYSTYNYIYLPWNNQQLDSIKVFDKLNNEYTKGFKLCHSADTNRRRTLDSLQVLNFRDNKREGSYEFSYLVPEGLPRYEALGRDHYGLYNGEPDPAWGSQLFPSRGSNPSFALYGTLTRIKYPTGGSTEFEFEPNQYAKAMDFDPMNTANPVQLLNASGTAGNRIKKIISKANYNSVPVTKEYFYTSNYSGGGITSSGILGMRLPFIINTGYIDRIEYTAHWNTVPGVNCDGTFVAFNNLDNGSEWVDQIRGGYVTYSEVTEKNADGSYVTYKYSNSDQATYRDAMHDSYASADAGWMGGTYFAINESSNYRLTANDLERGNIIKEEHYNNSNQKVKEISYQYLDDPNRKNQFIKAFAHKELYSIKNCGDFRLGSVPRGWTYRIYCYKNPLQQITETSFEPSGAITQTSLFTYDDYGNQTSSTVLTSDGRRIVKSTKFNSHPDFLGTASTAEALGIKKLFTDYRIKNYPIEILSLVGPNPAGLGNDKITGGSVALYFNERPVMSKLLALELNEPFQPVTYNSSMQPTYHFNYARINNGNLEYDSRYKLQSTVNSLTTNPSGAEHKPISITSLKGHAAYTWDYNLQHMTSITQNAAGGAVAFSSFEGEYTSFGTADDNKGNWKINRSRVNQDGFTGRKSYLLTSGDEFSCIYPLANNKRYRLSFWSKGATPKVKLGSAVIPVSFTALKTSGDWHFYSIMISGTGELLSIIHDDTQPFLDTYLDEARLYPEDALMTSYTYDPGTGNVTAITDEQEKVAFYHYDGMGRLIRVTDEKGNILKTHKYQIQGAE